MKIRRNIWLGFGALGVFIALIFSVFISLPVEDFDRRSVQSLRIVDRNGILLREYLNDQDGLGEWKKLDSISLALQKATVAIEDKRFFSHIGIDPIAVMRSVIDNIAAMRFKSGGSTLTQQVIRNVYRRQRTLLSKILEMWEAVRLEMMFSKNDILEQYLNRSPYGNQLFGVEAASRWYFDKPACDLSLAESAFLAALPNAPALLNPYRNFDAALSRQRLVLQRMMDQKKISDEEYQRALVQPLQIVLPEAHFKAPHVAAMVEAMIPESKSGTIETTIDYPLQEQVQWLMRGHLKKLKNKNVHNAAALILDNSSGEILALVGSADFFDSTSNGQVNGATALRQPGSAVKPFMYALALEHGLNPATLIADIPTAIPDHHGDYVPENYDKQYHGPVRLRTALACSYNVPAVRTLQLIGKSVLLEKMKTIGFTSLAEDAEFYGYGLTLGNAEVSLLELTTAYMSLANGGVWRPSKLLIDDTAKQKCVFDVNTAFLITDILKDASARRPAFGGNFNFPFQCAVKTGTTKDYKDNWTIGYTTRYTVGVWVGNFNGDEMRRVSGVSGAGPIFTDIMTFLHSPPYGQPPADFTVPELLEKKTICARSGKIPTNLCNKTLEEWFVKEKSPSERCAIHREYLKRDENGFERKYVYEIFPPEYSSWVLAEGLPLPPPDAKPAPSVSRVKKTVDRLMIVSPNSGDYFKIDPVLRPEYQIIRISGFIPNNMSRVILKVNESQNIPFNEEGIEWRLRKGVYRFQLFGYVNEKQISSNSVVINVE